MAVSTIGRLLSSVALLAVATLASVEARAQSGTVVAPGGDPARACGQRPEGRAYWTEYGFCDIPWRGPAAARGLLFWSHGVSGDREQYKFSLPPLMRRLALQGWDVLKINRNNLHETGGWTVAGVRHRADLIERARAARAQGYRAVGAAGQSYGGAISLEANARVGGVFDLVIATSPGHGSDLGQAGGGGGALYRNLDRYLLEAVSVQKSGRVMVLVARGDTLHPNRDNNPVGPALRVALAATGRPFLLFDETMPFTGHGAGGTRGFDERFGACVARFADPDAATPPGETRCD